MTRFLLPFAYGFATRAKSALNKLSFFAVFVLPLFAVCMQSSEDYGQTALRFVIAFVVLYSVYEIGYLQNDVFTTRNESHPTIRLSQQEHEKTQKQVVLLIAIRVFYALAGLSALLLLGGCNMISFAASLIMLFCVFGMHNTIRSSANALTYLLLCSLKYFALPLLFLSSDRLSIALVAVFLGFVLPRSIEHASKPKYRLPLFSGIVNHDRFRVIYYFVLSLVACTGWYFSSSFSVLALISLWFLGYRSLVLVAILRSKGLKVRYR